MHLHFGNFMQLNNRTGVFQLQLQLICNEGDELTIRGFSLGIADGIAEKSLQSIQIASIPGDFNGVADGTLHSGRRGLEGLSHLRIEYLCDGIDGVPTAHLTATAATVFVDDL